MFTKIAVGLLSIGCVIGVSGCSILGDPLEKAAEGGGKLVTFYCNNVTIPEVREKIRERVNAHAAPNSVAVTCVNGGPALNSQE